MTAIDQSSNPLTASWYCRQDDVSDELETVRKLRDDALTHLHYVISNLPIDDTPAHRPLPMSREQAATYDAALSSYLDLARAVASAQVEDQLCQQRHTVPPRRLNNPPLFLQPPQLPKR